ncbi:MAG TPA: hypothetical protein VFV19_05825 [Candidatus Polarisedimenticolaceae bacterium]|nr:hypothetical protein [Candidatus Polarisedimenticolaceae bacterium]
MSALASLVLIAIGATSPSGYQWYEDGKPVADTTWRKGWGQYGAMLHITDKPDELFAAWEKPGAGVPVSITDVAERGKPVVGVVFFTGCSVNDSGNCDAQAVFQVFKPDGSPYGKEEKGVLWNRQPPTAGQLQLSVGAIGVRIEPQDPVGIYSIRARLHDVVSGAEVELTRTFRVEPEKKVSTP